MVRVVGPRLPLRRARPRRPRLRQGAAPPAVPGVVHAPERPAARLRVVVQRREPAGARVGGAAGVRDRRRPRLRLPRARPPQAAPELHLVGEPQGRRRQQRVRGRLPRARQHRPDRPVAPTCRTAGSSSSPTAPRGWRCSASTCSRSACGWPRRTRRTPTSPRSSSSTSPTSRRPCTSAGCGARPTASTTTCCRCRGPTRCPLRVRSMVGLLPMCATAAARAERHRPHARVRRTGCAGSWRTSRSTPSGSRGATSMPGIEGYLLSIVGPSRLERMLERMLDDAEFLSPYGIRSLSKYHGTTRSRCSSTAWRPRVDYEPAESRSGLFGGNSNWRGPVWFPVNYLLIQALRRFGHYLGDDFLVEHPAGSGTKRTLAEVADDLGDRLIDLFRPTPTATARCSAATARFAADGWRDQLLFFEYFDGDTGAGLGASHQTGWTGLVADLVLRKYGRHPTWPTSPSTAWPSSRSPPSWRRSSSTASAPCGSRCAVIEILLGMPSGPMSSAGPRSTSRCRSSRCSGWPSCSSSPASSSTSISCGVAAARRRPRVPLRAGRRRRRGGRARPPRPRRQPAPRRHPAVGDVAGPRHSGAAGRRAS